MKHPLTTYRETHDLTLEALATQFGVTRGTVWRWEKGMQRIDNDFLEIVADTTKIPICQLRPDLVRFLKRMKREVA